MFSILEKSSLDVLFHFFSLALKVSGYIKLYGVSNRAVGLKSSPLNLSVCAPEESIGTYRTISDGTRSIRV